MGTAGEPTDVRTSTETLAMYRGTMHRYRDNASGGTIDLLAPAGSVPSSDFEQLADGSFVLQDGLGSAESIFKFTVLGAEHPDPFLGYVFDHLVVQRRTL